MIEDIKKTPCVTADKLCVNMGAAEYMPVVLGRIFIKYIFDTLLTRLISGQLHLPEDVVIVRDEVAT